MNKDSVALRPPMGWNSYDYYDTSVTEADVLANAAYMAEHLKDFGWEYVVVDIQWYAHRAGSMREQFQYIPFGTVEMDEYSRLLPDPERFPSSRDGAGFKPLADQIHQMGLKFGIHIMRGIPRIAAHRHGRIKGSAVTADMAADPSSICRWNPDMYGLRDIAAGQAYYDSLLELYASWGVDFIKCDDICNTDNGSPHRERQYAARHEIEMLSKAIERCGRPIVLSLSPGPALIDQAWHYARYANMWRITDDFWDDWELVKRMFERCELWHGQGRPGCWPDCDMLPFGMLGKGFGQERQTRLTREEQLTVMTLWCIFRSPLMLGAQLTALDDWTRAMLTNREALSLLAPECQPRQIARSEASAVWTTENTRTGARHAALFNLADEAASVSVAAEELGGCARGTDVWTGRTFQCESGALRCELPAHGCALLRLE